MLEYEKKVMLAKDEYLSILIQMCKRSLIETQTNYYFDNDDFSMNKKGITCRIRGKDGKFKATVKNHNCEHPECSVEVDLEETLVFNPQIFSVFGLHYQGELVTERIVMYKDAGCKIVLDRNIYLGNIDFELEIEYCKEREQMAQRHIERIAKCLVATKHLNCIDEFMARVGKGCSKSERFFKNLKNLK